MAEHDNLDLTYEEALQEIQDILGRMQSNELGIDSLTENIQRASLLLDFCQGKLEKTEAEVQAALERLGLEEDAG